MFEVYDPLRRLVRCTDDQWNKHILVRRAFMGGHEQHVAEAIRQPLMIAQSGQHVHRNVYYAATQKRWRLPESFLRIVVEFEWQPGGPIGAGFLITAFPVARRKSDEGTILWPTT